MRFSDLFGLKPFWRRWLEPIYIGCGFADYFSGMEWISRLWSSKSASTIFNIVIVGRCVRGRDQKGNALKEKFYPTPIKKTSIPFNQVKKDRLTKANSKTSRSKNNKSFHLV